MNAALKADRLFKENIQGILEHGDTDKYPRAKYADGVPAHSQFITQVCETYDLQKNEFPLTTLRPIPVLSGIKEILWIYQDQSADLELLKTKYGVHWWDPWESKQNAGSIGQRYGATVKRYALIDNLLNTLQSDPDSRRLMMSLWQETDLRETDGLFPCAFLTMWSVRNECLDCTLIQRSSDYLVAGHVNKMQYVALQMMIARHVGLLPGKFTHFVNNLHIYDRHRTQAETLLAREPTVHQPCLILNKDKKNFYDFCIDDFTLFNYEPIKPQLTFELGI